MPLLYVNLIVLAIAALFFWWLSGYDTKLTGENQTADRWRRGVRCGLTLLVLEVILWRPPTVILLIVILALIWAGCLAELAARGFHWLIDSTDKRAFDPAKHLRELDAVGVLIRKGKKAEAIQLCKILKEAGEVDLLALELTLEHLGVPQKSAAKPRPLSEASRLRSQGKFAGAETILKSLLRKNPANVDAALLLIRLYAQDLRRMDLAMKVLEALEQQPHVSSGQTDFARRSIGEWCQGKPKAQKVEAPPEFIDELLAQSYFGTALEILEQKIGGQPDDFDSWLKFAEAHALHCNNFNRAEKIVREIAANPVFTSEQIQLAKTKLEEWREAGSRG
ncbi:MAG: tetratricopeptide repeat protein [Limisphaerales bacterium]